jgi:hypothetical protein
MAAAAAGPQAEQILQANYLIGACFSNLVRIARVGGAKKQNHDDYIRERRHYYIVCCKIFNVALRRRELGVL